MEQKRPHYSTVVVGRKFTGKSTFLYNEILPIYVNAGKKVLIITATDPKAYESVIRIRSWDGLKKWLSTPNKVNIVKFYDYNDEFKMIRELNQLCARDKLINNMCIVFEDASNYIDPNPDRSIKNFLVNHRMYNSDLIFTLHAIEFIPKFFLKMISFLTIFKTKETLTIRKLEDRGFMMPETIYNNWIKVMAHP